MSEKSSKNKLIKKSGEQENINTTLGGEKSPIRKKSKFFKFFSNLLHFDENENEIKVEKQNQTKSNLERFENQFMYFENFCGLMADTIKKQKKKEKKEKKEHYVGDGVAREMIRQCDQLVQLAIYLGKKKVPSNYVNPINVIKGLNNINKKFSKCFLDCEEKTSEETDSELEKEIKILMSNNLKYGGLIKNYYKIIKKFKKQIDKEKFRESLEKFCDLCKGTATKFKNYEIRIPEEIKKARQKLIQAFDDIIKPLGSGWNNVGNNIMEKVLKLGRFEREFMIRLYEVNEEVQESINGSSPMSVNGRTFRVMDNEMNLLYKDLNILGISCKDIWENYKEALNVEYEKLKFYS